MSRRIGAALAAWSLGALALAHARVPYDDEWFSIELALRASPAQLWQALDQDLHPPWLALVDRAVAALWPDPLALQSLRVLASALAIALLARTLAARLRLPSWLFALAACQPIVLFYAGSARWYPFLLLAHALRLSAIWVERPLSRAAASRFIGGATLGALTSYADPLFLLHDAGWLLARARATPQLPQSALRLHAPCWRIASRRPAVIMVLGAVGCSVAVRLLSPLAGPLHQAWPGLPHYSLRGLARFAVLGVIGEAGPPWPWLIAALLAVGACGWALVAALQARATRGVAGWLVSYGAAWLIAVGLGAWHPRYALLLWLLSALFVLRLAGQRRWLAYAGLAYWLVVLGLIVDGRSFFKSSLNRLEPADCGVLQQLGADDLLVISYPGLAAQLARDCPARRPPLVVPSIRRSPAEHEQLAALAQQLTAAKVVWSLTLRTRSSLALTDARVTKLLMNARCRAERAQEFASAPHAALKQLGSDRTPGSGAAAVAPRLRLERWRCAPLAALAPPP